MYCYILHLHLWSVVRVCMGAAEVAAAIQLSCSMGCVYLACIAGLLVVCWAGAGTVDFIHMYPSARQSGSRAAEYEQQQHFVDLSSCAASYCVLCVQQPCVAAAVLLSH